jgi:hypothetical protein
MTTSTTASALEESDSRHAWNRAFSKVHHDARNTFSKGRHTPRSLPAAERPSQLAQRNRCGSGSPSKRLKERVVEIVEAARMQDDCVFMSLDYAMARRTHPRAAHSLRLEHERASARGRPTAVTLPAQKHEDPRPLRRL